MFPAKVRETTLCFAPLERGEVFRSPAFYEHLAPNGAKQTMFSCTSKLNPRTTIKLRILISLLLVSLAFLANGSRAASSPGKDDGWSPATNGLQARLKLVEKGKLYGTRWLVTLS